MILLPVWVLGASEMARLAWLNTTPGLHERNGFVKGRDFVQFYVAGTLAREGRWAELYEVRSLRNAVAETVPAAAGQIPAPAYGPQVALFFAPWSHLPYLQARVWWGGASALVYFIAAWLVIQTLRTLRRYRPLVWMTVICNPALALLLSTGHMGAIAVLAWACATVAFMNGRMFLFGVSLGFLFFKPQLLLAVPLILLLLGQWTALAGVMVSAGTQLGLGAALTGVAAWREYARALTRLPEYYYLTDTLPHQEQSLNGFFRIMFGPGQAAMFLTIASAMLVLWLWLQVRRRRMAPAFLPMLAAMTVLLNPHFYAYDLVVLTPALLVSAAIARERATKPLAWTTYALLFAPFSGALAADSHIQLFTIGLSAFFVVLQREWIADAPRARASQPSSV